LARLTDPTNYVGEAAAIVDRVVARTREVLGTRGESLDATSPPTPAR